MKLLERYIAFCDMLMAKLNGSLGRARYLMIPLYFILALPVVLHFAGSLSIVLVNEGIKTK